MKTSIFAGIDVGASRTKVILLDEKRNILARAVRRSGTDFSAAAAAVLKEALDTLNPGNVELTKTVATGYGRQNIPFVSETKTEISCHARGCYHFFPRAMTVVDIGGQDNKIITVADDGRRTSFRMNRKCAAGTGAFLEEMALRLDLPLAELEPLACRATGVVELGSYCTVFSATEVLEKIRQGYEVPAIVKGLFLSVLKRIQEMSPLNEPLVMTGGVVAHNPYLVVMMSGLLGFEAISPPLPQFAGALGAALYAQDKS